MFKIGKLNILNEENINLINDFNFDFQSGRIYGIVSMDDDETYALFKTLSGYEKAASGNLFIDRNKFKPKPGWAIADNKISACFPKNIIFENLNLFDNLLLGNPKYKFSVFTKVKAVRREVQNLLDNFEFVGRLNTSVARLAESEKLTIPMLRSMLFDSQIYMFYKPFEKIPYNYYGFFKEYFHNLKADNKTVIVCPDNINQLFEFCDEVLVIRNGNLVFNADVHAVTVEDIYDIMNNSQYNLKQAIANRFGNFERQFESLDEYVTNFLRLANNFYRVNDFFCIFIDELDGLDVLFSLGFEENLKQKIIKQHCTIYNEFVALNVDLDSISFENRNMSLYKINYDKDQNAILGVLDDKIYDTNILNLILFEATQSFVRIRDKIWQKHQMAVMNNELHQSNTELSDALKEKTVLLQEVHHRVKNNMQVICSLLRLQSSNTDSQIVKNVLNDVYARIHSMASIHEELYKSDDFSHIDMKDYLHSINRVIDSAYRSPDTKVQCAMNVSDVKISLDRAVPCGLMMNEILTNAYKHAFVGRSTGKITVDFLSDDNLQEYTLKISDDGVGCNAKDIKTSSLGFTIIESLVEQLMGTKEVLNENGTSYVIKFPF